jgi:hypothetical protein
VVSAQYLIAGMLIVCGAVTAWAGPDMGTNEDGQPYSPSEKWWVRRFGLACTAVGLVMLVATVLGYRAPPADGPGVP